MSEATGTKKPPMPLRERILKYLSACPPAIEGQNGSTQTFAVARSLYNGFALSESEVFQYLQDGYNLRCTPPWSEKELLHKASEATKAEYTKVRGYLLEKNGKYQNEDFRENSKPKKPSSPIAPVATLDPATEIEKFLNGFRCSEVCLWEESPVRPDEDWTKDGVLLVQHLYQPGELINFVVDFKLSDCKNGLTKAVPSGYGTTMERDDLVSIWNVSGMPQSDAGGWMRINPLDGLGITDKNVTAFRYILLEFDSIPLDLQMSLLAKLPLPIAAILTSGGRSVHAWCKADCASIEEYRATSKRLMDMLAKFGLDGKNKNPARLSRLVGVTRLVGAADDGKQKLLFLNPTPKGGSIL